MWPLPTQPSIQGPNVSPDVPLRPQVNVSGPSVSPLSFLFLLLLPFNSQQGHGET